MFSDFFIKKSMREGGNGKYLLCGRFLYNFFLICSRIFFFKKAWGRWQNIYMLPENGIYFFSSRIFFWKKHEGGNKIFICCLYMAYISSVLGFFSQKSMREATKYLYVACKWHIFSVFWFFLQKNKREVTKFIYLTWKCIFFFSSQIFFFKKARGRWQNIYMLL